MQKKKTRPSLSTYLEDIYGLYSQIDTKSGEFIDWADKELYGKDYQDAFRDLLQNDDYEVIDQGIVQNGSFKKIIQHLASPLLKIIIYHDKKGIINTVVIETNH